MTADKTTGNTSLIKSMLASQYLAVLASAEQDRPYSNLVAFAEADDLKTIYFATNRNTRKYRNISANENVCLLVDTRSNERPDFSVALALTVIGTAEEVKENERVRQVSIYLKKHPGLKGFISKSDTVLLKVTVSDYIIAGFNKTEHVIIK